MPEVRLQEILSDDEQGDAEDIEDKGEDEENEEYDEAAFQDIQRKIIVGGIALTILVAIATVWALSPFRRD
jgi:hypothetical protein